MKQYTGWEYLCIDVANQMGKDKLPFEDRIEWVMNNLPSLESQTDKADKIPLYRKAVMTLRKAQQGIPTGHLVGLDATCSGIQVMSALTCCARGAAATGITGSSRADAYTLVTEQMNVLLGSKLKISRKDAKEGTMTAFYGSKATPKRLFGEDTPELNAFYGAVQTVAPGAWELLNDLLSSWKPYALSHEWQLPDGFEAKVKVMTPYETRVEVDELDHATFTYKYKINEGQEKGLSNVANVVHSVDAYLLRSMHRRCNYDSEVVRNARDSLNLEQMMRRNGWTAQNTEAEGKIKYYLDLYHRSGLVDVVILPYIKNGKETQYLSDEYITKMLEITEEMMEYAPFELVTVHDEFKAHPNNLNVVRQQYVNILADIAESSLLNDLLSQLYGCEGTFEKLSKNLGAEIRKSEYALC